MPSHMYSKWTPKYVAAGVVFDTWQREADIYTYIYIYIYIYIHIYIYIYILHIYIHILILVPDTIAITF